MRLNKIYEDLEFTTDFSVEDWNNLVKLKLGKYFGNDTILEQNKELLRTEIVNFIRFSEKTDFFILFEWTFSLLKDCIIIDKQKTIKIIAESFEDISNTDMRWMTNVLTQPDTNEFSERDKISYYFKVIDETLEGAFKPRFKLLDKLARIKSGEDVIDNSTFDFGILVRDFPTQFAHNISLFLKDPYFAISTNQWRNIAAHKSYKIGKSDIVVEYGKNKPITTSISHEEFYKIVYWTQDIYRVIRFAQVLIDLNYIDDIVSALGGTENLNIRFESSLLHLIHNMQIVGFEFISTEEQGDTFCLKIKGKAGFDLKSSLVHASQCLDQLSWSIHDDKFVRDNFQNTQICIVDKDLNTIGSAKISIEVAMKRAKNEIDLNEYLQNMEFKIKNNA